MSNHQEQYTSERFEAQADSYNSIVFRLDPTPILESVKAKLLNLSYDPNTNSYVRVKGLYPKFKEAGVEELMLELYARMSVDKALSNLDRNEINTIIRQCGEVIHEFIFFKGDLYDIQESDWNEIRHMILHNVRTYLSRALNGRENELLTRSFQQRETIQKSGHTQDEGAYTKQPISLFKR